MSTVNGLKDFFCFGYMQQFSLHCFESVCKNSTSKNRNCVILQRSCLEQLKERKTRGKVLS